MKKEIKNSPNPNKTNNRIYKKMCKIIRTSSHGYFDNDEYGSVFNSFMMEAVII